MKDTQTILGSIIAVIALTALGYYIYSNTPNLAPETELISEDDTGIKGQNIEDATVEVIQESPSNTTPIPSLDSKVNYAPSLGEEVIELMREKITANRTLLKNNPNLLGDWIQLGIQYKIVGDLDKTREAWEYVVSVGSNSVALQNLGDLYGYYLGEPQKAEEYFLEAINVSPNDIYLYFKTADFYKDIVKDEAKRRDIVEQGLLVNPDSPDLKNLLDSL